MQRRCRSACRRARWSARRRRCASQEQVTQPGRTCGCSRNGPHYLDGQSTPVEFDDQVSGWRLHRRRWRERECDEGRRRHRCRCQLPPLVHQVSVEAVGHCHTRYRRFWPGAFGQTLGLEGCAVASPEELLGVLDGAHLIVVGGHHAGQLAGLYEDELAGRLQPWSAS